MAKFLVQFRTTLLALLLAYLTNIDAKNIETLSRQPRVVGGSVIFINQAEYQVSLRSKSVEKAQGYGHGHICNCALITPRVALTAAHCLWNTATSPATNRSASDLTVVLGTNSLYNKNEYTKQYNVLEWVAHGSFNLQTHANDIALIFFNGYIPWGVWAIQPVALNKQAVPSDTSCKLTSWGQTTDEKVASYLNVIYVAVLSDAACAANRGSVAPSMLCATYNNANSIGVGTCNGDDGAPLVCSNRLVGINSWGNEICGKSDVPAVYTNISYYQDWITTANSTFDYTLYKDSALKLNNNATLMLSLALFVTFLRTFFQSN